MKIRTNLRHLFLSLAALPLICAIGLAVCGLFAGLIVAASGKQLLSIAAKFGFLGIFIGLWWGMIEGLVVPIEAKRYQKTLISFVLGAVAAPVVFSLFLVVLSLLGEDKLATTIGKALSATPLAGGIFSALLWLEYSRRRIRLFSPRRQRQPHKDSLTAECSKVASPKTSSGQEHPNAKSDKGKVLSFEDLPEEIRDIVSRQHEQLIQEGTAIPDSLETEVLLGGDDTEAFLATPAVQQELKKLRSADAKEWEASSTITFEYDGKIPDQVFSKWRREANAELWRQRRPRIKRLLLLLLVLAPPLLLSAGAYCYGWVFCDPLDDVRLLLASLFVSLPAFALLAWLASRKWGERPWFRDVFRKGALELLVIFILFTFTWLMVLNGDLDSSTPQPHTTTVLEKDSWIWIDHSTTVYNYLIVQSWRDPKRTEKIYVSDRQWREALPNQSRVEVITKNGAFGFEWVKSVQVLPPEADGAGAGF